MRSLALMLLALGFSACQHDAPPSSPAASATPSTAEALATTPPEPAPDTAAPAPAPPATSAAPSEPPECKAALAELQSELDQTPGSCESDADCTCYPGGTPLTGCGGVSNLSLAKRIATTTQKIHGLGCGGRVNCAARACNTQCKAGKCAERN
jgi:hypothetical protein